VTEIDEMRRMMLALSKERSRVFRNNVAQGVVGNPIVWVRSEAEAQSVAVRPGDAVVRHARVLHAGLFTGSHDLIGWTPVEITPALVGRTLGVFTSIEAKFGRGKMTPEQETWLAGVERAGGITGVAFSADQAVDLVRRFRGLSA
jgi:hypothetical protein